jgi:hypothetical protein
MQIEFGILRERQVEFGASFFKITPWENKSWSSVETTLPYTMR